jgi:transposase
MKLRGVGPIGASAIVATVGTAHEFRSGRQFAAWLSIVPRQHSSGGNAWVASPRPAIPIYVRCSSWGRERCSQQRPAERIALAAGRSRCRPDAGYMRAVVAIAAKNARLAWAMLRRGEDFRMSEVTAVY